MFEIAIDTGGTFTDGALLRDDGTIGIAKAETRLTNLSKGAMDCIQLLAASENGLAVEELLAKTRTITLGSTIATNTIVELNGAKTVMITTKNFKDILEMRRVMKENLFNLRLPKPLVLVPRYLRFGVEERVGATGEIITPLNESEVHEAIAKAKYHDAEIVAVCFLHSYINPQHERRVAEIIRADYPELEFVLSSSVLPRPMEFERFNTTVIAAYIKPRCSDFIKDFEQRLKAAGFKGVLLIMTGSAGVTTVDLAIEKPISMVSSGPSAGPLFASSVGKRVGFENIIALDMGGTSTDISVIPGGRILTTTDSMAGDQRNAIEVVDVRSIGAGGGSIAWLDARGILNVGPHSAGADPGPVCYGKGGTRPTLTDAAVVLGYIPADYFLGGEIKLDSNLAEKAIKEQIADPLSISVVDAAYGISSITTQESADAILAACTSKGYDPRRFAICCGGGAGPVHVLAIADKLGIKDVYIPKVAGVFCAYGIACADFKHEVNKFISCLTTEVDLNELSNIYRGMKGGLTALLEREGATKEATKFIRCADVRYYGQIYELEATMPEANEEEAVSEHDLEVLTENFHKKHHETYGHADKTLLTEIRSIRLRAISERHKIEMTEQPYSGKDPSNALRRRRPVCFKELEGFVETPCYDGDKLRHGNVITGPAVVEEKTTTLIIPPKAEVSVDRYGNYAARLGGKIE